MKSIRRLVWGPRGSWGTVWRLRPEHLVFLSSETETTGIGCNTPFPQPPTQRLSLSVYLLSVTLQPQCVPFDPSTQGSH